MTDDMVAAFVGGLIVVALVDHWVVQLAGVGVMALALMVTWKMKK